jgi:hypothetical protein
MSCKISHKCQPCGRLAAVLKTGLFVLFLNSAVLTGKGYSQPQAHIVPHPEKVHLNELLQVTLELVWSGEVDMYDIPGPDLSGLPEFKLQEQSLSASRRGEENVLTYQFTLKPLKEGSFDLGTMNVRYFEKGKDVPVTAELPQCLVTVQPPERFGAGAKAGIAVGATFVAGGLVFFLMMRTRTRTKEKAVKSSDEAMHVRADLLAELESAKRLLLEGETGRYVEELCRLLESDPLRPFAQKAGELHELAESLRFGAQAASPDQLKWAEKSVRESIEKAFPQNIKNESEKIN